MNRSISTSGPTVSDPRDTFDAASIPGMRAKLADAYRAFRAAEAAVNVERAPPSHGGRLSAYRDRPCPKCGTGSEKASLVATGKGIRVVECPCGLAYAASVLGDRADADRYIESFIDDVTIKLRDTPEYLQLERARSDYYLDLVSASRPPRASLLEIGCGSGTFLLRADGRGWDTLGIEPGQAAFRHARSRGANVVEGFFPEALVSDDRYGVVAILDVLEHVIEPQAFLAQIHDRLLEDGILFVQVPNWESLLIRLEGGESTIVAPGHWSYFTAATLCALVEGAGFVTVATETVVSELDRILAHGKRYEQTYRILRPHLPVPDPLTAAEIYRAGLGYKLIAAFRRT